MSLMQRLVNMQYQLQEAEIEGELDQFISDQHEELNRLLTAAMVAFHKIGEVIVHE